MNRYRLIALVTFVTLVSAEISRKQRFTNEQVPTEQFTDTWVVELLEPQHTDQADLLANKHGFVNLGQVGNLEGYYSFKLMESINKINMNGISENQEVTLALESEANVGFVKQQKRKKRFKKDYSYPNDPDFSKQWSLVNSGQTNGKRGLDLNVEPVWLQGITGNDVVVSIMDDGLEVRHPDLSPNYDSSASWDFVDNDNDPTPTLYSGDEPDSHGTSCAGEIAMTKDNDKCGVGVAYKSKIGCLKFDVGGNTDAIEARSLGYKNNYIQVYSNSWGPSDIGFIVDGPGPLLSQIFEDSVSKGRDGKGSIYVWAAGNGGWNYDSCAADGYSSSIYTISVGSADQTAGQASYDEQCAGKLVVTYSFNSQTFSEEGDYDPYNQISTTTLNEKCTDGFTGTSASTPLVSGVITLALQANANLTWRDVQYLLVYTSNSDELSNGEWTVNGRGLKVSHKFGFGAVDAEAMVTRARHWITVPPQMKSVFYEDASRYARYSQPLVVHFNVSQNILFLEHVVVKATLDIGNKGRSYTIDDYSYYVSYQATSTADVKRWLENKHPRRGDIKLVLTSPQGTDSTILPYRKYDFVNTGNNTHGYAYDSWPFTSVHYWGEDPNGEWTLTVTFKSSSGYVSVSNLELIVYGTDSVPQSVLDSPTQCDEACARGCYGSGPTKCDTCKGLRVVSTLECVSACPTNTFLYKGSYCTDYLITISQQINVALVVGLSVGLLGVLACVLCIAISLGLRYACRRTKNEREHRHRYRVLSSEGNGTSVTV